jgi:hypothetical protein
MIERLQRHGPFVAAALMAIIAVASPVAAQQTAESIWSGGPILTMNDKAMRADGGVPDISPLLVAFGGHRGPLDGCAQDAMFRLTAVMASGRAGR